MTINKDFFIAFVKAFGRYHDVVHLRISNLWENLQIDGLPPKYNSKIEYKDVQPYLLGDSDVFMIIGAISCVTSAFFMESLL